MDTSCVLQFKNLLIYTRLDLQFYLLFRHSKTEITRYWEYRYVLSLSFCTISHVKESRRYLEEYSVLEFPRKSKKGLSKVRMTGCF